MKATKGMSRVVVALALLLAGTPGPAAASNEHWCLGKRATIVGTSESDRPLLGTSGPDVIVGRGGGDLIRGRGGNDRICGGSGFDTIHGGRGRDRITDFFYGGDTSRAYGGPGNDVMKGRRGVDLRGDGGNDRLVGYHELAGGAGDDVLIAAEGSDPVFVGDAGDDILDARRAHRSSGSLTYEEVDHAVRINLMERRVTWAGHDRLLGRMRTTTGTDFNDVIIGDDMGQLILGGAGDDHIRAHGGHDFVAGQVGSDEIFAGPGDDDVLNDPSGEPDPHGEDQFHGGVGDDHLSGEEADDRLWGDSGNDTLVGGDGNDYASGGDGTDDCDTEQQAGCELLEGFLEGTEKPTGSVRDDRLAGRVVFHRSANRMRPLLALVPGPSTLLNYARSSRRRCQAGCAPTRRP